MLLLTWTREWEYHVCACCPTRVSCFSLLALNIVVLVVFAVGLLAYGGNITCVLLPSHTNSKYVSPQKVGEVLKAVSARPMGKWIVT